VPIFPSAICNGRRAVPVGSMRRDGMVARGWCLDREVASNEADMSLRTTFALAVVITLSAAAAASAAAKKQRVPRSGSQSQAVAPRSAAPFNPYSPSLTGAGSPGYNQSLMTWR
jgi:hypothetical protein